MLTPDATAKALRELEDTILRFRQFKGTDLEWTEQHPSAIPNCIARLTSTVAEARDRQLAAMPVEGLTELVEWTVLRPKRDYAFARCRYCGSAWWDTREEHNYSCIVPRARQELTSCAAQAGEIARLKEDEADEAIETKRNRAAVRLLREAFRKALKYGGENAKLHVGDAANLLDMFTAGKMDDKLDPSTDSVTGPHFPLGVQ